MFEGDFFFLKRLKCKKSGFLMRTGKIFVLIKNLPILNVMKCLLISAVWPSSNQILQKRDRKCLPSPSIKDLVLIIKNKNIMITSPVTSISSNEISVDYSTFSLSLFFLSTQDICAFLYLVVIHLLDLSVVRASKCHRGNFSRFYWAFS